MEIFKDSFDHYNTADIPNKWDTAGTDTAINITVGVPRTGRGCLQIISSATGPTKTFDQDYTNVLMGFGWYSNTNGTIMLFQNFDADVGLNATNIALICNADRSVSVQRHPPSGGPILGTSAAGLILFNTYNHVAMRATIATLGSVDVWINGVQVLALTNVNTTNPTQPTQQYMNGVTVMGPGGTPTCFIDDVFIWDCSTAPNSTFPGPLRIYADVADADVAVTWTPLVGPDNYQDTDEIPPDGDTSYVFSSTVGQVDQYRYPMANIPANSRIYSIQHVLDMKVDSGARVVASNVNGTSPEAGDALSSDYHMFTTPYDTNPATGVAWVQGDLPISAGPEVTA